MHKALIVRNTDRAGAIARQRLSKRRMTNSHGRTAGKGAEVLAQGLPPRKIRMQRPGLRREAPSSAALRLASPPQSPQGFAGSKWGDSPEPAALPRPPMHWTCSGSQQQDSACGLRRLLNLTA